MNRKTNKQALINVNKKQVDPALASDQGNAQFSNNEKLLREQSYSKRAKKFITQQSKVVVSERFRIRATDRLAEIKQRQIEAKLKAGNKTTHNSTPKTVKRISIPEVLALLRSIFKPAKN